VDSFGLAGLEEGFMGLEGRLCGFKNNSSSPNIVETGLLCAG
jgi:hypothetical protein